MKKKIAIIGSEGYVGKAFQRMVRDHYETVCYDLKLKSNPSKEEVNKCDLGVICVPTPMSKKGFVTESGLTVYGCDTSIVETVVSWLETPIILIKSTVSVGTTLRLSKEYDKHIVFSPEYVGETKYAVSARMDFHSDMKKTPFLILGGESKDCNAILDILLPVLGPEKTYFKTDSKTAEFIKYKENDYFAHKVVWAAEAREQAEALGVDWYDAWLGWGLDPRVDKMHTAVFQDKGFAGACLPKDTNALAYTLMSGAYYPELLIAMLSKNLKLRGATDYYDDLSGRKNA